MNNISAIYYVYASERLPASNMYLSERNAVRISSSSHHITLRICHFILLQHKFTSYKLCKNSNFLTCTFFGWVLVTLFCDTFGGDWIVLHVLWKCWCLLIVNCSNMNLISNMYYIIYYIIYILNLQVFIYFNNNN